MNKKDKERKNKIDLIIKIVLIIIIILLLIHNCALRKKQKENQNNLIPNTNVDIIDIKCDDNKCQPTPSSNPTVIESVSFAQKTISIKKGDRQNLVAIIKPSSLSESKLKWSSSNPSIATVDENGMVKGLKEGTVTITVKSLNGKTAVCTVKVISETINVKRIVLKPNKTILDTGETGQIVAKIEPENATNRDLVWESSDPSIATVDDKGIVKGIKNGTVTITAKTKDGKIVAITNITIKNQKNDITSLSFSQDNVSVKKGNTLGLVAVVTPSELSSSKLEWTSSDSSVATVDSNGVVKGLKEGTVTITATSSNGKVATCTVNVTIDTVEVKKIILNSDKSILEVGEEGQIVATIEPENATNRELVWTSSDSSVATVDDKGIVKGIKNGTVTITAKTKDGKVVANKTITIKASPTPTPKVITSLAFVQDNVGVKKGNTIKLVAIVTPSELSNSKLTWTSSDLSIATVDSNGVVKGLKEGTVTITVTSSSGVKTTCTVNVTIDTINVENITLNPEKTTLRLGETGQVIATIEPENATDRELIWTSSDSSVATVDSNGIVTGIKKGNVTITAKTKDGRVSATTTITIKSLSDDGFKIYDDDHGPLTWNGADDLKIFTNSMYGPLDVIAPESSSTYQFVVKNSTNYNIKYSIKFIEKNDYHINMKYKLKKNDTYIVSEYVTFDQLNITDYLLDSNNSDTYYLEWKWVSSSNDTEIGKNPEAKYGLQIKVEAESVNE